MMAVVAGGRPGGAGRLSLPGVIEWLGRVPAPRVLIIAGLLVALIGVGDM